MAARAPYPSTLHFPFSETVARDDKLLKNSDHFKNHHGILTMKMDGENSSLYRDYFHARSVDSRHHPSRDWLKNFHASFAHNIPEGFRICGENLYAKHSIEYFNLPSYFMAFSIWDNDVCLDWISSKEWFGCLGLEAVPVLYEGVFDEQVIKKIIGSLDTRHNEGVVWRNSCSFHYDDFGLNVAKWVRPNHVQTNKHWSHQAVITNHLV